MNCVGAYFVEDLLFVVTVCLFINLVKYNSALSISHRTFVYIQ